MAFRSGRKAPWRRLGTAALAAAIALGPLAAQAQETARHAVLVVDANTGRVLYQRSAEERRFPASLTKLMTLLLLFEHIEQGRIGLNGKIRFSANAASASPSRLDVAEGAEIDVSDAIKALIVKSANDVAIAVAEHIAGSEERFAAVMNRKARELGMTDTVFRNASGLPDPEQVTTARDMITLALRLYDQFPKYYPLFATRTFTWGGETYRNHNTLLFRYQGLDGMKTGYIRASGFNLVASARRGKKHVLAAYFGGKTSALRNAAVRAQLDAGLLKASEIKTRQPGPLAVAQAKVPPAADPAPAKAPSAAPAKAAPPPEPKAAPAAMPAAPHPASRPSLAAAPGVEIVRVRPVLVEGATSAPGGAAVSPPPELAAPAAGLAGGVPAGPFQVQVGAFQTQDEAERQLAWVRQRAGSVLGEHAAHTSQVKRGDKVFFRARYVGFEAHAAAAGVCSELKRLEIDCLVTRAE